MADPATIAERARANGEGAADLNGGGFALRERLAPLGAAQF